MKEHKDFNDTRSFFKCLSLGSVRDWRNKVRGQSRMRSIISIYIFLAALLQVGEQARAAEELIPNLGIVVEELSKDSALLTAGILPGDQLLSWRRPPGNSDADGGSIVSVFDWEMLEIEQAPRGRLEIAGSREGQTKIFEVMQGPWDARIRPSMPDSLVSTYLQGGRYFKDGDIAKATSYWETVARNSVDWHTRCWMWVQLGDAWVEKRNWEMALAAYHSALTEAQEPLARSIILRAIGEAHKNKGDLSSAFDAFDSACQSLQGSRSPLALAESLIDLGGVAWEQGNLEQAMQLYKDSLSMQQETAPDSLPVAASLNNLGVVFGELGDHDQAIDYLQRALAITERLEPQSRHVANSLANLGAAQARHGNLEVATDLINRGFLLFEKIDPESLDVARSLNDLGFVADERGDLSQAMQFYQQSLAIREKLAPASLDLAESLNNIGGVAWRRGNFDQAADFIHRAVKIMKEIAPDSLYVAYGLSNLGAVAERREDLDAAREYDEEALELLTKIAPDSLGVAQGLTNLGVVAFKRGELQHAADLHQQALTIRQRLAPGGLDVAKSLNDMGVVAYHQENLIEAENLHQQAMDIRKALAPGSVQMAYSLHNLGNVATARGKFEHADDLYRESLEILQKSIPGSLDLARLFYDLGVLNRDRKPARPLLAEEFFGQALDTLDKQLAVLGGSYEVRGRFRAEYRQFYRAAIEMQLDLNQYSAAFYTLERSRARVLIEQLAERDSVFNSDIPDKLDRERRQLAVRFDRIQEKIAKVNPRENEDLAEQLMKQLAGMKSEYDHIIEEIRRVSPRLAALAYPKPLGVEDSIKALDPDTVMLSYSVGENRTDIFVLSAAGGFRVESVRIGEREIRDQIKSLRRGIQLIDSAKSDDFNTISEKLYRELIAPVEDLVEQGRRLVIIPDRSLHLLPFGALRRTVEKNGKSYEEYLTESKPLHIALSATVYAEIMKARRPSQDRAVELTAFGDPLFAKELRQDNDEADAQVRSAYERGIFEWPALPYSRREVTDIARLFSRKSVRIYLGKDATEEAAKSIGRKSRLIHFATHAYLDDRFPLDSFLALTLPETTSGRDNGLLQAWEIFERVRIEADLVVLSACATALGEDQGGDGLIGLTRAFQYAGAHTVVSSLWNVNDQVTAALMVRFYKYLRAGKSKDEALQAAQLDMIRKPIQIKTLQGTTVVRSANAPYYWASFEVIGDWR